MKLSDYVAEPVSVEPAPIKIDVTESPEVSKRVPVVTCDQLTDVVLNLTKQIDDLGRKSVPLVIECGKHLIRLRATVPDFKGWKEKHKDRISDTTIKRYIRVHNWVTSDPVNTEAAKGMTLNEIYEAIGIFNGSEEKPDDKGKGSGGAGGSGGGRKKENISDCQIAFARFVTAFKKSTVEEKEQAMINVRTFITEQEQNEPEIEEAA